MADSNPLRKKIGPLEVWQYVAIGTSAGFMYYLYEKKKGDSTEPKEELAASTPNPYAPGGGGSGESGGGAALPGVPGVIGEPGPAGAPGTPGASLTPEQETTLTQAAEALNKPPTASSTVAPQAKPKPAAGEPKTTHTVNKYGEHFTVHEYASGRKEVFQTAAEKAAAKGERALYNRTHKKTKAGDTAKRSHARPKPLKAAPRHVAKKAKPPARKPVKPKKKAKR